MSGRRRSPMAYPAFEEPSYDRDSAVLDPSPLVRDQYCREGGSMDNPLGDAREIRVRPSSSWESKHGDFGED